MSRQYQQRDDRRRDNRYGGGGNQNFHSNQMYNRGGQSSQNSQNRRNVELPQSKIYPPTYPTELKPGTEGKPIKLIGNFYKLITDSVIKVYHYRLKVENCPKTDCSKQTSSIAGDTVSPSLTAKSKDENLENKKRQSMEKFFNKFSSEIIEEFVKLNAKVFKQKIDDDELRYIYSGLTNFYTNKELCLDLLTLKDLPILIEGRTIRVQIEPELVDQFELDSELVYQKTKLNSPDASNEKILALYDILFGFLIGQKYQSFRRHYFDLNSATSLRCKSFLESVSGFLNSVRRTQFGLALNVQLKTGCKISGQFVTLLELIQEMIRSDSGRNNDGRRQKLTIGHFSNRELVYVNRILRGLRVFTKHSGKSISYQIDRLILKTPDEQFFRIQKTNKSISIANYFQKEYGIELKPLPLVQTIGGRYQLPLELCYLYGNQFLADSKLKLDVQTELLRLSTFSPNIYFDKLQRIVESISKMDSYLYDAFKIKLISKPVEFAGRVLEQPRMVPGNDSLLSTTRRSISVMVLWFFDNSRAEMDERQLDCFVDSLRQKLEFYRFDISGIYSKCLTLKRLSDIERVFLKVLKRTHVPDLLITGIMHNHREVESSKQYSLIKHFANQKYGLASQCFDISKVIPRCPAGYLDNLILKINAKIGGRNCEIDSQSLRKLPIDLASSMFVGVDVNHPGATEKMESSIACAVGSYDQQFYRYTASIRVQKRERLEVVTQLESMMDELLDEYQKKNHKHYPVNIVVFRDGVSEGQFKIIRDVEIPLIQKSLDKIKCSSSKLDSDIKLTVLVVQKRHHTRFVLAEPNRDSRKPTHNVSSGTVVDHTIVDPNFKMFYLNSHFSPLGTSKSTKYVLLRDDQSFSTDQLQQLCYLSCHNCARTRKPISIPIPVRYADLCAYRSKLHITAQLELQSNQMIVHSTNRDQNNNNDNDDSIDLTKSEFEIVDKLNRMVKIDDQFKNQLYYC